MYLLTNNIDWFSFRIGKTIIFKCLYNDVNMMLKKRRFLNIQKYIAEDVEISSGEEHSDEENYSEE